MFFFRAEDGIRYFCLSRGLGEVYKGQVMTATAMTAARRETWSVDDEPMPTAPAPDAVPDPTQSPQVQWVRRYQMRFIEGGIPTDWAAVPCIHLTLPTSHSL